MQTIKIHEHNFHDEVMNSHKPVLLDFWASWCGPCRMVVPLVEQIAEERSDIIVGKVNIDEEPKLAIEERIEVIPTLVLYKDGQALGSIVAPESKGAIEAFLKENL